MIHYKFTCLPFYLTGCLTILYSAGFDLKYFNLWVGKTIKYFNISTDFATRILSSKLSNFIDFSCVIFITSFCRLSVFLVYGHWFYELPNFELDETVQKFCVLLSVIYTAVIFRKTLIAITYCTWNSKILHLYFQGQWPSEVSFLIYTVFLFSCPLKRSSCHL